MKRPDLDAARAAAVAALGKTGGKILDKLDAAGLVVVHRSDLPGEPGVTRTLENVTLLIAEPWAEPWKVIVQDEEATCSSSTLMRTRCPACARP